MKYSAYIFYTIKISIAFLLVMAMYSCNSSASQSNKSKSFLGDEKAVTLADQMFDAIGGKEAWCDLKSLYIKAMHTEPQMTIPYQSEIWRAIDTFELVIEQQNDSFHVKGVFSELGGNIRYYDKRDTSRTLSDEQLKDWEFDHNHNIYVLLHKLGCDADNYKVQIDENERLAFYQDSTFITSLGLDDQLRPYMFFKPNTDGSVSGSIFTDWGTDNGLVHSAGGHPLDSNFIYTTEIWEPAETTLKERFGEDLFDIDPK